MKQLRLEITTKSPVIITSEDSAQVLTGTKTYFTGSMIRGMLAELFIQTHDVGKEAHKNEIFRDLFLSKLVFTNAYPTVGEERAYPLPKSLQRSKTTGEIIDLVKESGAAGFKGFSGMGIIKENEIYLTSVRSSIHFHMSRQGDTERFQGKSQDGGIYNYESIDAGQTFIAYIYGDEAALQSLASELSWTNDQLSVRCGRSRRTGYGLCQIRKGKIEDIPCNVEAVAKSIAEKETLCLRLDSTLLGTQRLGATVYGINGVGRTVLEELKSIFGEKIAAIETSSKAAFGSMEKVQGFVGIWGVYRPEAMGLSAGSIIQIKTQGEWTKEELYTLHKLLHRGIGERCEEGFGQLRFWVQNEKLRLSESNEDVKNEAQAPGSISDSTKELLQTIIDNQIVESIRKQAYQDVQYNATQLRKADRHVYAQLESYIKPLVETSKPSKIDKNITDGINRIMQKNWGYYGFFLGNKIGVKSESIAELLLEYGKVPKWVQTSNTDINQLISDYKLDAIADDTVRKEYWTWFFRYARKVV